MQSQLPEKIRRTVRGFVDATLLDTPVTVLQGARQVGKSTLAADIVAARGGRLVSLDDEVNLGAARLDPAGFVRQEVDGVLALDEVQRAPELVRAVKAAVDEDRRPGRFLLTGSSNLLSLSKAEDSLAGRAETVPIYGFSRGEIEGRVEDFVGAVFDRAALAGGELAAPPDRAEYVEMVCAGSYPEARSREGKARERWFQNYRTRLIQRDAAEVSRLTHTGRLGRLLSLIASSGAGELVKARLARSADMPETTITPYVRLLEDLGLVHSLPAWGRNLGQRVVGRPKLALLDSGLAADLLAASPERLSRPGGADYFGGLLETFVAGELRRQQSWSRQSFDLYHYRTRTGEEVDLVIEARDGRVIAIEVKAAYAPTDKHFRTMSKLRDRIGEDFVAGFVLHTGPAFTQVAPRLWAAPIAALWHFT